MSPPADSSDADAAGPATIDAAAFLDAAVREGMLTAKCAKDLKPQARASDSPPARFCVDAGRLTPIQAEAIEGLLRPGSIADGYEVVGLLGYGGIGVVYRARQPALDRIVALKTIGGERLSSSSTGARFQQEARAIAKLKHPNIVTAYDYGRCSSESNDGRYYLAMELVDGTDLDNHIRKRSTLDERDTWLIVQQVAAALAHANDADIVHRDIKPANLLLTAPPAGYPLPEGVPLVKVTDFGLVQLQTGAPAEQATRLTVSGATMGTPNYMAPEQINDAHVDHLADIYALGATAYHMLTGRPPYAGQSLMKVITSKLSGDTEPLDSLPGEITTPTRELLESMMAHDPAARPPDYADLLRRVATVLQGEGLDSRIVLTTSPVGAFSNTPSVQNAETVISDVVSSSAKSSRRRFLVGGGTAVLAAAGGGVWWAWPRGLPTPQWERGTPAQGIPREFPTWTTEKAWSPAVNDARLPYDQSTPIDGTIRCRLDRTSEWQAIGAPKHFGVALTLFRGSASSLELALAWREENALATMQVSADEILTVQRDDNRATSHFRAADLKTEAATPYEFRLERDERYWIAYRSDAPGNQVVGAVRVTRSEPPDTIVVTARDGEAYLSEARVYALKQITGR